MTVKLVTEKHEVNCEERFIDDVMDTSVALLEFFQARKASPILAYASLGYFIGTSKRTSPQAADIDDLVEAGKMIEGKVWENLQGRVQ